MPSQETYARRAAARRKRRAEIRQSEIHEEAVALVARIQARGGVGVGVEGEEEEEEEEDAMEEEVVEEEESEEERPPPRQFRASSPRHHQSQRHHQSPPRHHHTPSTQYTPVPQYHAPVGPFMHPHLLLPAF